MAPLALAPPRTRTSAASVRSAVQLWAALPMAVAGGSLFALAYALHPVWWAAWLAPAPVLAAAISGPVRRAYLLGAVAGLTAGATTLSYYVEVATPVGALTLLLARGLFWSAAIAFAARAAHRLPATAAVFALPLFASAFELILMRLSPYADDGSLAHSQMGALPVVQIASLGGAPAVLFVVLCGGSLLGLLVARLMGATLPRRGLAAAAALVVAVVGAALAFGLARLVAPASAGGVPVFTVSTDRFGTRPTSWTQVWSAYGPAMSAVARAGAIVVAPEKVALLSAEDARVAARQLSGLARSRGATLVVGLETRDEAGRYLDRALVASADGRASWYDKQRLVPGLEARDTPGRRPLVFTTSGLKVGVAICKDMHAPDLGRTYGRLGAQLMVVPAFDFGRDGWLSDRLTALRGVENGYAIVRAARSGVSSISDRFGRILAEVPSPAGGMATLSGRAPVDHASTPYRRFGDAFGWLSLLAAMRLGLGLRRKGVGGGSLRAGRTRPAG